MLKQDYLNGYYNVWLILTTVLGPQLLFGSLLSLVFTFIKPKAFETYTQKFFVLFLFSVFGAVVGFLTGASREPVVGTVLPILITTVVTYISYLTTKTITEKYLKILPYCILVLLISALLSALFGMNFRMELEKLIVQQITEF